MRWFPNKVFEVPRYYFHIRSGRATLLDHDGVDLPSLREAAREATRRGREIASADAIVVADEQWSTVFEVPVEEAED